jgi:hypothetical protein
MGGRRVQLLGRTCRQAADLQKAGSVRHWLSALQKAANRDANLGHRKTRYGGCRISALGRRPTRFHAARPPIGLLLPVDTRTICPGTAAPRCERRSAPAPAPRTLRPPRLPNPRAPAKSVWRGARGQLLTTVNNCKQTAREARRRSALPQPLPRRPAEPIGEPEQGDGEGARGRSGRVWGAGGGWEPSCQLMILQFGKA